MSTNGSHEDNMFSFSDFRKWMDSQHDSPAKKPLVGVAVEARNPSEDTLSVKIKEWDGELEEIISEFIKSGGVISEVIKNDFIVEVDAGSFKIHRSQVKRS